MVTETQQLFVSFRVCVGFVLVVSFFLILILFGWELGELGGKHFSPFLLFLGEEGEVGNTLSESAV